MVREIKYALNARLSCLLEISTQKEIGSVALVRPVTVSEKRTAEKEKKRKQKNKNLKMTLISKVLRLQKNEYNV